MSHFIKLGNWPAVLVTWSVLAMTLAALWSPSAGDAVLQLATDPCNTDPPHSENYPDKKCKLPTRCEVDEACEDFGQSECASEEGEYPNPEYGQDDLGDCAEPASLGGLEQCVELDNTTCLKRFECTYNSYFGCVPTQVETFLACSFLCDLYQIVD